MKEVMYLPIGLGIMGFLLISGVGLHNYLSDNSEYDYCIKWDGWIDRDNMIFNCYNLQNNTQKCAWEVLDNQQLKIYHLQGLEYSPEYSIYDCSKYIKTKEV